MKRQIHQPKLLAVALAAAFAPAWAQQAVTTAPVEIVGTTPLAGIGVPRLHLPTNVLSLDDRRLEEIESLNIAEQLQRQAPAVTINEIQGNPYQADLNYRGFTASPLLGTAQGLSIYVDGVRVNEPFGDTVNWDLIPHSAIAGIDLIPGSNPAFGLNTLGGALAIRTKSGFSHPGGKLELSGGASDAAIPSWRGAATTAPSAGTPPATGSARTAGAITRPPTSSSSSASCRFATAPARPT